MEHDRIEEDAVYLNACENVKKIASAIKAIRIKYYPNFSKISEADQKAYQELQTRMYQISNMHGLTRLSAELIGEISKKYSTQNEEEHEEKKTEDDFLLACYGAIDAEAVALSQGKLKHAMRCQAMLMSYISEQNNPEIIANITKYKREKFAEIAQTKDSVQEQVEQWTSMLKEFNEKTPVTKKQEVIEIFGRAKEKDHTNDKTKEQEELVH